MPILTDLILSADVPLLLVRFNATLQRLLTLDARGASFQHRWPLGSPEAPHLRLLSFPSVAARKTEIGSVFSASESMSGSAGLLDVCRDLKTVVSAGFGNNTVRLIELETGSTSHVFTANDTITCVALAPDDSRWLAVGCRNGGLFIWFFGTGGSHRRLIAPDDASQQLNLSSAATWAARTASTPTHCLVGHEAAVRFVELVPDVDLVISGSRQLCFLHRLSSGRFLRAIHPPMRLQQLARVRFSAQDLLVAYYADGPGFAVFSLNGRLLHWTPLLGGPIDAFAVSSSGRLLISAGNATNVRVFRITCVGLEPVVELPKPPGLVLNLSTVGETHILAGLASGHLLIYELDATVLERCP